MKELTIENKELLLKDLCARLPYGVIVDYKKNEFEFPHWKITTIYPETLDGWISYNRRVGAGSESGSIPFKIGKFKPYLRPMSSMTEEEREEYKYIAPGIVIEDGIRLPNINQINWLNAHHFDYRGLIEKGLALVAPEGMYNIKEK